MSQCRYRLVRDTFMENNGPPRLWPAGTEITSDQPPSLHWMPLTAPAWEAWLAEVNSKPLFRDLNMPSFEIPEAIRSRMTTRRGWNEKSLSGGNPLPVAPNHAEHHLLTARQRLSLRASGVA